MLVCWIKKREIKKLKITHNFITDDILLIIFFYIWEGILNDKQKNNPKYLLVTIFLFTLCKRRGQKGKFITTPYNKHVNLAFLV